MAAIKRCKGCIFWNVYNGEIANPAMRKMMNLQPPGNGRHACTLRLHATKEVDDAGDPIVKVSFNPKDEPGPRYGQRTNPNASCKHQTAKHAPYRTPPPVAAELVEQVYDATAPLPALLGVSDQVEATLEPMPAVA